MNKQRIRDIQGDTLIKRLGICGEQQFHCIHADRQNGL